MSDDTSAELKKLRELNGFLLTEIGDIAWMTGMALTLPKAEMGAHVLAIKQRLMALGTMLSESVPLPTSTS